MSKIWIKENRNSFTSLHQFGFREINLTPNAIKQMIMTPALQEAIDAGYIVEVVPIWNALRTTIVGFTKKDEK